MNLDFFFCLSEEKFLNDCTVISTGDRQETGRIYYNWGDGMATENSLSSSTGQKGALPFPREMPVLWEMVQGITVINTIGGTFTRWPLIDLISVSQISAKSAGYTSTPTGSERKSLISWPHNRNWDSARRSCSVW